MLERLEQQKKAFGEMRKRIEGRRRQGLIDQPFRTCEVDRRRVCHPNEHVGHQYGRQSTLCLDGFRIERQCALEQINCLPVGVRRPGLQ